MQRAPLILLLAWAGILFLPAHSLPAQSPSQPQAKAPNRIGDHVEPTSALAREHQYHSSITGRILRHDGSPAAGATVVVLGYRPYYWSLPLARVRTDENGLYRCDDITGHGRVHLWVVSPEDSPFSTTSATLTLISGELTKLRPVTLPKPGEETTKATTFRAKLLAKDGQPIAGAMLRLTSGGDRFDPSCFGFSGPDGVVEIAVRTGTQEQAQLFFARSRIEIEHKAGEKELSGTGRTSKLDLTGERTIKCDQVGWAEPQVTGADNVHLAWQLGESWQPCVAGRAPCRSDKNGNSWPLVRAVAAGHLPRILTGQQDTVDFADDVSMQLQVVDDRGESVAARVDLCSSRFGSRFQETWIQTLPTAADGSLRLRGPKGSESVLYIYADGCEPTRAHWKPGAPLQVSLQRRIATLQLSVADNESTIYVRRSGTFDLAAMVYPQHGTFEMALAPGSYEVTRYHNGPVAAAMAVALQADTATKLALGEDQRPTITLRLPDSHAAKGWWAHGSRGAVGGMVANRAMWTQRGGAMPTRALAAEVEPAGEGKLLVRFPTGGRYTLMAGHKEISHRAISELHVQFGENYEVALPRLDGKLSGTIAPFSSSWEKGMAIDGVAGPRVWLEPRKDTMFGMLITLPNAAKFELKNLVTGAMTLHHHLYETGMFRSTDGTWGGQAITIGAKAVDAGTLTRADHQELEVQVLDRAGSPVHGTLQLRDRMSESWQRVMAENSTLIYASDPIPTPPSAPLVNGIATLDKVRAGPLHFELRLHDGRTAFFARDAKPGELLKVQLAALE